MRGENYLVEESIKPGYGRVSGNDFQRWYGASILCDWILKPPSQITNNTPWLIVEYNRRAHGIFDDLATFIDGKYRFYQVKDSTDQKGGIIDEDDLRNNSSKIAIQKMYDSFTKFKKELGPGENFELVLVFKGSFGGVLRNCIIDNGIDLQDAFIQGTVLTNKKLLRADFLNKCQNPPDFPDFLSRIKFLSVKDDPEKYVKKLCPNDADRLFNLVDKSMKDPDFRIYYNTIRPSLDYRDDTKKLFHETFLNLISWHDPLPQNIELLKNNIQAFSREIPSWYGNGIITFDQFYGRVKELVQLLKYLENEESIEIYGIGGIGKSALVQLALFIKAVEGFRIVVLSVHQQYVTGNGYPPFKRFFKQCFGTTNGYTITIEDVIDSLKLPGVLHNSTIEEKIKAILDQIKNERILLFIDDFQLADEGVQKLLQSGRTYPIIIASRIYTQMTINSMDLMGVEEIHQFLKGVMHHFQTNFSETIKEKIIHLSEGHPITIILLVRNHATIPFEKIEVIKQGFEFSRPEHFNEYFNRVIREILTESSFNFLRTIAIINDNIPGNIDRDILGTTCNLPEFNSLFIESNQKGFLMQNTEYNNCYHFTFQQIKELLQKDGIMENNLGYQYYLLKEQREKEIKGQVSTEFHLWNIPELLVHAVGSLNLKGIGDRYNNAAQIVNPTAPSFKRFTIAGEKMLIALHDIKEKILVMQVLATLYEKIFEYKKAEILYNRALHLLKAKEKLQDYQNREESNWFRIKLGELNLGMGTLQCNYKQYGKARDFLLKSLEIFEGEISRIGMLKAIAWTRQRLGEVFSELGDEVNSKKQYDEALATLLKIPNDKRDFNVYQTLAGVENSLGNFFMRQGAYRDARVNFQNALQNLMQIPDNNIYLIIPEKAGILHNLGQICSEFNEIKDAKTFFQQAGELYDDLIRKNYRAYALDGARFQINVGNFYDKINESKDAVTAYEKALKIFTEFNNLHPGLYEEEIAGIRACLGNIELNNGQFVIARSDYTIAQKILNKLQHKSRSACETTAMVYQNLSTIESKMGNKTYALELLNQAIAILIVLRGNDSKSYCRNLLNSYMNLGTFYQESGNYQEAEKNFNEAIKCSENLQRESKNFREDFATLHLNLGNLRFLQSFLDDAVIKYETALTEFNKLNETEKEPFLPLLAQIKKNYSNIFLYQGKFEIAEKWLKEVLDIYEFMMKKHPPSFLLDIIDTKNTLANLYRCAQKRDDASQQLQESSSLMKEITEQDAVPWQVLYFHNQEILGLLKLEMGGNETQNGIKILQEIFPHSNLLPNSGVDYFGVLGDFYLIHQLFDQALLWANRMLNVDAKNIWGTRIVAQVKLIRQEFNSLLETTNKIVPRPFEDIIQLSNSRDYDELCFLKVAALYSLNNIEEAEQICNKALQKNKVSIILFVTKISILFGKGLLNEAKELTSKFLNYFPNHPFGIEMLKNINEQDKPK